jgi:ABC-type Na+ efflux pump permease subunit
MSVGLAAVSAMGGAGFGGALLGTGLLEAVFLPIKLYFAWRTVHFFSAARENGLLEMLIVSPVTDREIVEGNFRAQRQLLTAPLIFLAVVGFVAVLGVLGWVAMSGTASAAANLRTAPWVLGWSLVVMASAIALLLLDLTTLGWMGAYLALRERRASTAVGRNILYVLVGPLLLSGVCAPIKLIVTAAVLQYARNRFTKPLRVLLQERRTVQGQ